LLTISIFLKKINTMCYINTQLDSVDAFITNTPSPHCGIQVHIEFKSFESTLW